ncbi:LOW QUALITY PROTEIN: uncharacterized protein V1477_012232, partial [Vespula maculifrons]
SKNYQLWWGPLHKRHIYIISNVHHQFIYQSITENTIFTRKCSQFVSSPRLKDIFADTIPSSINEQFTQVQYCITHIFEIMHYFFCFRIRVCTLGDFENLSRRVDFEIFADTTRGSIKEQSILGILGFEKQQQYRTSERLLQSLAQLCFGLRRGNIEIFADTIPSSINEKFTQVQYCITHIFEILIRVCTLGDFENLSRRVDFEIFADTIRGSIKQRLYNMGILGFAKQQQYRFSERLLQSLAQLCFGLRRGNLEIFADTIPCSINEKFTQVQYCITHIFEILIRVCTLGDFENLSRRVDFEIFADTIRGSIKQRLYNMGILGFAKQQQYRFSERLLQSLAQLCFGLRRGNLEIFADTIPCSINEKFTQVQYCITHIFEILIRVCTLGDFENLSRRVNFEIFADTIRGSIKQRLYNNKICEVGILGFAKQQQYRFSDRLLQSLAQLCFGLRRGNLEIFADTIPSSINEKFTQVQYCITHIFEILIRVCTLGDFENLSRRVDFEIFADTIRGSIKQRLYNNKICEVGILGFAKQQQYRTSDRLLQSLVQLCFGLRRGNLEIFADTTRASIKEELILGILGFSKQQQYRSSERLLQSLDQLCFGLRRGNLEILADTTRASIKEQLILGIHGFAKQQQYRTSDRLLQSLVQLCFGLRRGNLEIFADTTRASIKEQLIRIYNMGILGFSKQQQYRTSDRLLQSLDQLCFGLRRGNLEIFADTTRASIKEQLILGIHGFAKQQQYRSSERLLQSLDQLCFGLRRGNLEILADTTRASIKEQLILGIHGFAKQQQYRTSDRLLQSLVQLCFGLRRGNLEIFADTTRASIKEQLIRIYNILTRSLSKYNTVSFIFSKFCTTFFVSEFEFALSGTLKIYVEEWTSKFSRIPFVEVLSNVYTTTKFAKWGDGLERRQQYRSSERLLQSLAQLCFGLRRGNLEIFADTTRASIKEQLILGILGFAKQQQYRFSDRLLQSLAQLCFGLRRGNLEIFADTIPSTIYEEFTQVQYSITHIFEILYYFCSFRLRVRTFGDFENLSRRMDLKVFADAIRASIREQLIRIYNSLFDLRLNLRSGETASRDDNNIGPLSDFYTQLCFGLRRGNLEIFADTIPSNINEKLRVRTVGYFENLSRRRDLEIFTLSWDFDSLSPEVDLEIFALTGDFENLSLRVDLEIFPPLRVFDNLFPRVNLEILAESHLRKY